MNEPVTGGHQCNQDPVVAGLVKPPLHSVNHKYNCAKVVQLKKTMTNKPQRRCVTVLRKYIYN